MRNAHPTRRELELWLDGLDARNDLGVSVDDELSDVADLLPEFDLAEFDVAPHELAEFDFEPYVLVEFEQELAPVVELHGPAVDVTALGEVA